jgi:phage gp29-like protein
MAKIKKKKETKKNLKKEAGALIASAQNDITIPFFNEVFINQDPTLLARGGVKGLAIYDEIERDTFAFSVIQKRKKTLIAREWQVIAGGEKPIDHEAREFVEAQLDRIAFDRLCESLLDATMKGYSVCELVWGRIDDAIVPVEIKDQEQRRFMFDKDWHPRLLTQSDMFEGRELPPRKFIVHRFGVKGNNPYGLGMGTRLFFPVLFKREGVAFWLKFLEKFASPTVIGKTPYGTLDSDQRKIMSMLQRFHSDGAMTVPVDVDVDLLEAKRSGAMSGLEWVNYWDKQMSIAMLGETLTTDLGAVGSRAAAEVHSGVLDKLVDGDADLLSDTLHETLIAWLIDYNFPGAAVPRVVRKRPKNAKEEAETATAKSTAALKRNEALRAELSFIADIKDDATAKALLMSSGLVDELDIEVIDALVGDRSVFKAPSLQTQKTLSPLIGDNGGPPFDDDTAFAAGSFKKKH